MVVAIGVAGRPIYEKALGDRAPGKPADISTVFPIGSITNQFTAACAMLLSEKHRLDLDSPVSRYVADVPHGKQITVRELLDQTTGLVDYSLQPVVQQGLIAAILDAASSTNFIRLNNLSATQELALLSKKPLKFRPGTQLDYSNTNCIAAGMVIEAASGGTRCPANCG
jgi:CubicO group peptidase (beta-lactamase class C family)